MKKSMLADLRPFVRYAQTITINDSLCFRNVAAYDFRLFYVQDGIGNIIVDGIQYRASRSSLLIWRPGLEYSLINEPQCELRLISLSFDLDFLNSEKKTPIPPGRIAEFRREKLILPSAFSETNPLYKVIYIPFAQDFELGLVDIVTDYRNKLKYYEHKQSGALLSLLIEIINKREQGNTTRGTDDRIEKILSLIRENYQRPLSNDSVAKALGYHKNHVNRLMVLFTGTSLHRYLQNYRLERAIELLESTELSVSEIASRVGFDDFSHFSKYFKSKVGYSPSKLRGFGKK